MEALIETTLSPEGFVAIPNDVQESLDVKPGQSLWVKIEKKQPSIFQHMTNDPKSIFGMLEATRHVSIEEMSAESIPEDDID